LPNCNRRRERKATDMQSKRNSNVPDAWRKAKPFEGEVPISSKKRIEKKAQEGKSRGISASIGKHYLAERKPAEELHRPCYKQHRHQRRGRGRCFERRKIVKKNWQFYSEKAFHENTRVGLSNSFVGRGISAVKVAGKGNSNRKER